MSQMFHGHEIMEMILNAETPYSRQTLRDAVDRCFGKGARFHTCSAHGLSLDELLSFLSERGKVLEINGVLHTSREEICDHG